MSASNLTIEKTLGDFIQNLPPSQEYLILSFFSQFNSSTSEMA